jgi:hypothetical protein
MFRQLKSVRLPNAPISTLQRRVLQVPWEKRFQEVREIMVDRPPMGTKQCLQSDGTSDHLFGHISKAVRYRFGLWSFEALRRYDTMRCITDRVHIAGEYISQVLGLELEGYRLNRVVHCFRVTGENLSQRPHVASI